MLYVFSASKTLFRFLADFMQLNQTKPAQNDAKGQKDTLLLSSDAVTPEWSPAPTDAALLLAPVPAGLPEDSCFRVVRLTDAGGRDRYPDLLTDSAFPDRVLSYVAENEETMALYDRLSSHFPPERLQVYLCPEDEGILRRILAEAKACASLPAAATPVLNKADQALLSELCNRFYASDAMAEELERLLCYLHLRCADPAGAVSDFWKDRPPVRNRKEGKACLASFREYCSLT